MSFRLAKEHASIPSGLISLQRYGWKVKFSWLLDRLKEQETFPVNNIM